MRAYSLTQMQDLGICVDDYKTNERDGVFIARLDYKRWGKKRNVLANFTFEDGSKVNGLCLAEHRLSRYPRNRTRRNADAHI